MTEDGSPWIRVMSPLGMVHDHMCESVAAMLAGAEYGEGEEDPLVRRARDAREHAWLADYYPLVLGIAGDPDPVGKANQVLAAVWKAEGKEGPPPPAQSLGDLRPEKGVIDMYRDTAENRRRGRVGQPYWRTNRR